MGAISFMFSSVGINRVPNVSKFKIVESSSVTTFISKGVLTNLANVNYGSLLLYNFMSEYKINCGCGRVAYLYKRNLIKKNLFYSKFLELSNMY